MSADLKDGDSSEIKVVSEFLMPPEEEHAVDYDRVPIF